MMACFENMLYDWYLTIKRKPEPEIFSFCDEINVIVCKKALGDVCYIKFISSTKSFLKSTSKYM